MSHLFFWYRVCINATVWSPHVTHHWRGVCWGAETSCGDDQIARVDAGDPMGFWGANQLFLERLGEFTPWSWTARLPKSDRKNPTRKACLPSIIWFSGYVKLREGYPSNWNVDVILDLIFGMIQYMHETPLKSLDNPVRLTFYVFFLPSIFDTSTRTQPKLVNPNNRGTFSFQLISRFFRMKSWYLTLLNNSKRRLVSVLFSVHHRQYHMKSLAPKVRQESEAQR